MKTQKVNLDGKMISQAALFVVKSGLLPRLTVCPYLRSELAPSK